MISVREPRGLWRMMGALERPLRWQGGAGFASAEYWRAYYAAGGTSGDGSYGRLADHKASVINDLVERFGITSAVAFGSGDGNQASLLRIPAYTGVYASDLAVDRCKARFADRAGWRFMTLDAYAAAPLRADIAMSLDVIYPLVEDEIFDAYMRRLVGAADRFVLVYASDHDPAARAQHVRHRAYSAWIAAHAPQLELLETFAHPYPAASGQEDAETSFAFFPSVSGEAERTWGREQ